jgi:hypothetical protein
LHTTSTSISQGIRNVPDGLTVFTDDDGCKAGCYIIVDVSDELIVSGTLNQADFIIRMFEEHCKGETSCHDNAASTEKTESYYNGTEGPEWIAAEFSGIVDGAIGTKDYMTILKHTALESVRQLGVFNDIDSACQDEHPSGDPDNSMGCNPHSDRYGYLPAQITASMYDIDDKDKKGDLKMTFDLKESESGFCKVMEQLGNIASIPPVGDAVSTGLGVATFLIGLACS